MSAERWGEDGSIGLRITGRAHLTGQRTGSEQELPEESHDFSSQDSEAGGNADDLGVGPVLVGHPEHPDRAAGDHAPGEGGILEEHQGVKGIAVTGQCVRDEAVVARIHGGGEEAPVEADGVAFVVVLDLLRLPRGISTMTSTVSSAMSPLLGVV